MLKMLIMLENNNDIFKEGSNGKLVRAHSDIIQNILGMFLETNCTNYSTQNYMIKENDQVRAKVLKSTTKKTPEKKSTVPNISENGKEKVAHCALLVIISCLVYANSLHGDLVHDDISAIVTNQDALGSSSTCSVFCNDFWGINIRDRRSHKSYGSVTILTFG
jgi:hypothetical protein